MQAHVPEKHAFAKAGVDAGSPRKDMRQRKNVERIAIHSIGMRALQVCRNNANGSSTVRRKTWRYCEWQMWPTGMRPNSGFANATSGT